MGIPALKIRRNMKFIISTLLILLIASCGFVSSDDDKGSAQAQEVDPFVKGLLPNDDFDGDLISNKTEQDQGNNPLIANLPSIRMRFLQNYQIEVDYKRLADSSDKSFIINTNTHQDNPDFKYRVGEVFIRNESFNTAASVGKFSSHSWGEMKEHDLSWVNYPETDPRFYSENILKYKPYFNKEEFDVTNITISLENNIKLKANDGFSEIKNLSLNFYYYDYEKESFELLATKLVERNFQAGINETFDVTIENVPEQLIATNYFKRGEFIISELADYEIPSLKTTYKKLLASVRKKSVPVIFNTPLSSEINYVGTGGESSSFSEILSRLYGNKVVILQNKLKKVNQFETNLPDFTYLSEIKELDKKGRWFVFTNKLRTHYLDHQFSPKDIISLSYITGKTLAEQKSEQIFSYRAMTDTTDERRTYPLGNISPNSRIHLQFKPEKLWGEKIKHWKDSANSSGSCGNNCFGSQFRCDHEFNFFEPLDQNLSFNQNLTNEAERIKIVVNQEEFSLTELVNEKKVDIYWLFENIHIDIKDISNIKEINSASENVLSLKLDRFSETTFHGILLKNVSGDQSYKCFGLTTEVAGHNGWPLSVRSHQFNQWQQNVRWDKIKKGHDKTYTQDFSVGITSIITNFYN
jgi:hypothetical protein